MALILLLINFYVVTDHRTQEVQFVQFGVFLAMVEYIHIDRSQKPTGRVKTDCLATGPCF